jgi:hypothetical protein
MNQEEFYKNISKWISQDKNGWNHITLLAYFCHKYEEVNGTRFRLVRWKSDPGKGKESRDFAKLFLIFAPERYKLMDKDEKLKYKSIINNKIINYINWMFDYKFRSGEKSVTGSGIFLMPSMINEFERMYVQYLENESSKSKIDDLILWCKDCAPKIFINHQFEDVDDLKMIESYYKANTNMGSEIDVGCEKVVIDKAKNMGLI